jgi:alpha-ketoglutarate-dependent taurine dioxygenase
MDDLMPRLDADGIVLLSETGPEDFVQQLAPLLKIFPHPHAAAGGWTVIHSRDGAQDCPGLRGFTVSELKPHTDRSFLRNPPTLLCFLLSSASRAGGDVFLVDTAPILRRYGEKYLSELQEDLRLVDPSGVKRQQLLSVANGLCTNRYRDDCVASPRGDSRPGREFLAELRRAVASPMRVALRPGDGYLIHNHRVLHGRSAFTGNRRGARLLAFVDEGSAYARLNLGFRLRSERQPKGGA